MKNFRITLKNRGNLFIIGLLGGVSSGKSTIGKMFEQLGAHVIDADQFVHQALRSPAVQKKIADLWGEHLVVDGEVKRKDLAKIVFSSDNGQALDQLENMVHPIVRRGIKATLEKIGKSAEKKKVVLDVALLWESGLYKVCDIMIFVDTPLSVRKERACKNRGWGAQEVSRREKFQGALESKKKMANFVIVNKGEMERTLKKVKKIWKYVENQFTS